MAAIGTIERRIHEEFGNLRHAALSTFWFGQNFLWIPVSSILLQNRVDALVPRDLQGRGIGLAFGLGGFLAVTVPPIVGAWSDRLNTRFGRRRPIMVVGTLLTLPGLFLMMVAGNYPELIAGYAIIQFFFNGAGAAYAGVVPDVVPAQQFGKASGFLGTMTLFGIAAGTGTTFLLGDVPILSVIIAVVVLISLVPALWAARGEGATPPPPVVEGRPLADRVREFLRPLHEGDLAWVIFTRLMVSAGITVVQFNLLNFFRYVVLGGAAADKFTAIWLLVVTATALPFGFVGGLLSDRFRRRKIFVYVAGAAQAFVALAFVILYPTSQPVVFALGVAYGVGYGLYYAVDWALAMDTLPDKSKAAKDMGLFHVALTFPQAFVPFVAGPVLDAINGPHGTGGYRVVFSSAVVFMALGTFFVSRIKSVR